MKTPSDELFQLIRSLNSREKLYFKIQSVKAVKGNIYVNLFDIINGLKSDIYDEERVKRKLKDRSLIKNIKHSKSRLSEAIIDSLEMYYSDDKGDIEIQRLLHQAEILEMKKRNNAAGKALLKAEKLALEYEKYEHLFIILSKKARHFRINGEVDSMKRFIRSDISKEQVYVEKLQNQIQYRNILNELSLITTQYNSVVGNKRLESKIERIRQHPLLSSPAKALTYNSLRNYYYILFDCTLLTGQYDEKAYADAKQWVRHVESKGRLDPSNDDNYLVALSQLLLNQKSKSKEHGMEETYERAKAFYLALPLKRKSNFLMSLFVSITSNYISSLTTLGRAAKAAIVWEEISGFITFRVISNSSQIILAGNLVFTYFLLAKYHEALKWTNFILSIPPDSIQQDIQIEMRMITLIIHYELENQELLKYLARSSRVYLKKAGRWGAFEKMQMDFFEKEIHLAKSRREEMELFIALKSELKRIVKTQPVNYEFDFLKWLDSKIKNRPFAEIILEKSDVAGR